MFSSSGGHASAAVDTDGFLVLALRHRTDDWQGNSLSIVLCLCHTPLTVQKEVLRGQTAKSGPPPRPSVIVYYYYCHYGHFSI